MSRLAIFILSILLPRLVVAYPVLSNCNGILQNPRDLSALRQASVKAYVYGNYLFPQMMTGIVSNQVAFYFQNPIGFREMEEPILDGPEFKLVVKAMNAAHAKHGIRPIEPDELQTVATYMMVRISQAIRQTVVHSISPSARTVITNIEQFEDLLFKDARLRASFEQAQKYAVTVQSAMHSQEVIELSQEYSKALESVAHLARDQRRPTINAYSKRLGQIIVSNLERVHPELKEPEQSAQSGRPNGVLSRAEAFWLAMSFVHLGPYGF